MNDAVFVCVLVVCGLYCDLKKVTALALKTTSSLRKKGWIYAASPPLKEMIDWWKGSARLMTKAMGNGHLVDLTWWVPMPPLITGAGIPPRTQEGGVDVGRQLKVTARCHTTVRSHYLSHRLSCSSSSSHDGQMTIIPALLFHFASSFLAHVCSVSVISA